MDLIKLFTDADVRTLYMLNSMLCFLGFLWTWGMPKSQQNRNAYYGWLVFWIGTGAYYLLLIEFPLWPFWEQQIGLYVATAGLLGGYMSNNLLSKSKPVITSVGIVLVAVLSDVLLVRSGHFAVAHQVLTAMVIGIWAWGIRIADGSKSAFLLTYALVQLPVFQISYMLGIEQTKPFLEYLVITYTAYAALKLPLIPVVCFLVKEPGNNRDRPNAVKLSP